MMPFHEVFMRRFAFLLPSVVLACGGAEDSSLLGDGGGGGGDTGTGGDGSVTEGGPQSCDVTRCAKVPDGFQVVSLVDANTTCPTGFDTNDVVSSPAASDGACTCGCNVTTQPDCTTGNVTRYLDQSSTPMCNYQATTLSANGGACTAIANGPLYLQYYHYATNAPPPSGGVCQFDATLDPQKISSSKARICAPPSSCQGAVCDGGPVCVKQDGDVTCPGDFPNKTLVGASATAECGACGSACTVVGQCMGTLGFYTDSGCSLGAQSFTADGTCVTNPASAATGFTYYQFKGSLKSATCNGTPPTSTATAKLNGATTVCCRP